MNKRYKVEEYDTGFNVGYKVIKETYDTGILPYKPIGWDGELIDREEVFWGDISDCYTYIKLKEGGYM